jgi:hypothetical protein
MPVCPLLHFVLFDCANVSMFFFNRTVAEHLPKTDMIGSIDSYVKFEVTEYGPKLLPSSKPETSVKKK